MSIQCDSILLYTASPGTPKLVYKVYAQSAFVVIVVLVGLLLFLFLMLLLNMSHA